MRSKHLDRHIVVGACLHRAPLRLGGAAVRQQVAVVPNDHRSRRPADVTGVVVVQELPDPVVLVLKDLGLVGGVGECHADGPGVG